MTFKVPLISSTTPHWKRTRVWAGQIDDQTEHVTFEATPIPPALGKPAQDREWLLAGAQKKGAETMPKAWGKTPSFG